MRQGGPATRSVHSKIFETFRINIPCWSTDDVCIDEESPEGPYITLSKIVPRGILLLFQNLYFAILDI